MGLFDALKEAAEESAKYPTQKLEDWPAFLRHRRSKDPENKGRTVLDEYETERLCNAIAAATSPKP